jgi:hypothetical protein
MHDTDVKFVQQILPDNIKGRDHSEDLGLGGRIVVNWIFKKIGWEVSDWIHQA